MNFKKMLINFREKEFGVQQSKKSVYKSDLDLNPMTLILKFDLDKVKMSHHTKNEVSMLRHSKGIARTDRQKNRQYENITVLRMWVVINLIIFVCADKL